MSEWREVALGEVLDIKHGYAFRGEHFGLGGCNRLVTPGNFYEGGGFRDRGALQKSYDGPLPGEYVLSPGALIVAMTEQSPGLLGSSGLVPHDGFQWLHNQRIGLVKPLHAEADERFIYSLFNDPSVRGQISATASGTKVRHTSPGRLKSVRVRMPSIGTQRHIAAILSAFDELIEINERRIEVLEALARSLYREWFVRFRFPGHAEVDFTDSELGPIPERWEVVRLGSTAKWFSGGTPSTTEPAFWDGDIPWISSGSLKSMLLDRSDRSVTPAGASVGSRIVERDTLLFVVRGMSLAREFRVGVAERTLAFGQDCKALLANDGVEPLYLAFSVFERRDDIQGMVELAGHGTGKLSTDRLKAVKYPLPPEPVQRAFVETVTPIREALATHAVRSRQLAATRDLLLPRLVTGRLDISDIDLGELLPPESA